MREFLTVSKALAESNRVRALMSLLAGELCVCQIVELLDLAPSTVSKHLSVLHQARLVESRKEGRWMYYRLADSETSEPLITEALRWVRSSVGTDRRVREDARRLARIRKMNLEELCRKQCVR